MAVLRFSFLAVSLATVLMGASLGVAGDSTTAIVNRTALDAGVIMVISNTDGKGDCDCSESLYGGQGQTSSTSGVEAGPVTIIPAAAKPIIWEPTEETDIRAFAEDSSSSDATSGNTLACAESKNCEIPLVRATMIYSQLRCRWIRLGMRRIKRPRSRSAISMMRLRS